MPAFLAKFAGMKSRPFDHAANLHRRSVELDLDRIGDALQLTPPANGLFGPFPLVVPLKLALLSFTITPTFSHAYGARPHGGNRFASPATHPRTPGHGVQMGRGPRNPKRAMPALGMHDRLLMREPLRTGVLSPLPA